MAHSRETEHYQLPLYDGTDIINPLTDFNNANEKIDETMYNVAQRAASAEQSAQQSAGVVHDYDERVTEAENTAQNAGIKADNTMNMIAEEFNPLKEGGYQIGDSVIYNQHLYTFINPHNGAWDAGDVVEQPIGDALQSTITQAKVDIQNELDAAIAQIDSQMIRVPATQAMIAPAFNADKVDGYDAGEVVTFADKLYQFNAHHDGVWTGVDVEQIDSVDFVNNKIADVDAKIVNVDTKIDVVNAKTAGKVVLGEEQFYKNTATATFKQKINDVCNHVISLFDNKSDDVADIIVDGIDYGGATFVGEWSVYDMKAKEVLTAIYSSFDGSTFALHTIVHGNGQNVQSSYHINHFTMNTTSGSVNGYYEDKSEEASSSTVSIAYHYLYKVEE